MTPELTAEEKLDLKILQSIFRTSKKTVQEFTRALEWHNRYKSVRGECVRGTIFDDRSQIIDLYDTCWQQDANLASTGETLKSQIISGRYGMYSVGKDGELEEDSEETAKIQGTQFEKIIVGILDSRFYGYTALEICDETDPDTGRLKEVNYIERRNVLPDQRRIIQRQGIWAPGWDFDDPQYRDNYVLVDSGDIGLNMRIVPLVLAKKYTFANYVNFSHTYGQPIIHGKTVSEAKADRDRLAALIASAAQSKVLVTGIEDEVEVKAFASTNSERIFTGLINIVDREVANLILGSQSMAGSPESYVGAAKAHQDIFRERVMMYRTYIENCMNELVIPRLVRRKFLKPGRIFKYAKRMEMADADMINMTRCILEHYEVDGEEIRKNFGIRVGKQLNLMGSSGGTTGTDGLGTGRHLTDEQYYRRYGHARGEGGRNNDGVVNFLTGNV